MSEQRGRSQLSDPIDTGFDAVIAGEVYAPAEEEPAPPPVTAEVTTGLTPEGVQAAKALLKLPALDPVTLAKLARDIAMDVKERAIVLKDFNLTEPQYEFLEANNEFFKAALQAACIEWHAPLSTPERLRVEAAAILEDSLPGLGARMQNKAEGLPGVIEAAKFFAKVANVGEREAGSANSAERFTINIDLGGDQKISVSTQASAPTLDAPNPPQPTLPLPQGQGSD